MKQEELENKGFIFIGVIKPFYGTRLLYHLGCIEQFFKHIPKEEFINMYVYQFTNSDKCLHVDVIICRNKPYYSIHTYWRQMRYLGSYISNEVIDNCLID